MDAGFPNITKYDLNGGSARAKEKPKKPPINGSAYQVVYQESDPQPQAAG